MSFLSLSSSSAIFMNSNDLFNFCRGEDGDGNRVEKVHCEFGIAGGLGDLDVPVSKSC